MLSKGKGFYYVISLDLLSISHRKAVPRLALPFLSLGGMGAVLLVRIKNKGGLTFGTILTLLVVPVMYSVFSG